MTVRTPPPIPSIPRPTMPSISGTTEVLHIQLFGGPRLFRGKAQIPLSQHQAAVLGMVFGTDGPALPRLTVRSCLWPNEDLTKARRRLNQLLYTFKKKVGNPGVFEVGREEIRKTPVGVSTDLDEYKTALHNRALPTCMALLDKGFISKAGGRVNRQHEDWIEAREAELRYEFRRRAERHWNRCAHEEEWEAAQVAAEVLLALTPSDERCLQRVMEARAKAGFPAEAEEAYRDFSAGNRGRQWSPQEETKALLEAIQSVSTTPIRPKLEEGRRKPPEPPLLGRDEERSLFRKTLKRVPLKDLRGVLISGEAGIGKTRLIREVLHVLPLDGQRVLSAESAELEKPIPLNPLIELFKGPEAGTALRRLDEPWRTVLFGVMPSHHLGEGPIPEAPHIQSGSVPRRLFEAFYQLLFSLVQEGPLILVVEDLQWADETTLTVLEFLIRRWDHGGLQLLLSVRADEVRRNPILGRFLENLRIHDDFLERQLGDLAPSASEELIRALTNRRLDADNISQLKSLAGGNPYFLIELTLEFLAGRVRPMAAPQDIVPIPLSILQVLERRLSQLSADADRVLGSLAVYSRPLDLPGLARIARLPGESCLSGLDQLHDFRLVTNQGADVSISHELVRQAVYQGLTTTRRAFLHNRVARHILRTRKAAPPDELAVHFHHAGASEEARLYSTEAADRAEASGAFPEALRFLRIAREHSDEPEAVADLIGRMGHLNYLHQNLEEAAPLLELAAQRFRRQGNQARALRSEVERIDCLAQTGRLPLTECLVELRRIKDEAQLAEQWGIYTKALDVEVHRLDYRGNQEGVRRVLVEARECADLGGPDARCRARAVLALNFLYGSPNDGLAAAREAVAIAMKTADTDLQLHALNRLILVLLYQGRLHTKEGQGAFALAEPRLAKSGDLILKFFIKLNKGVWHLEVGEFDRAKAAFSLVEPVIEGTKATDAHAFLFLNEGELGLATFDTAAARASYTKAEGFLRSSSPKAFHEIITAGLGLCALNSGDLAEARRREAELPPLPNRWTSDPSVVALFKASMLKRRGDHPAADGLLFEVAQDVKHRLVTAWIKLSMERAHLLRQENPAKAETIIEETLDVTMELGLEERTRSLRRLLNR